MLFYGVTNKMSMLCYHFNLHHQITMDTEMCCPAPIIDHISFVILETEDSMVVFGICI